MLDWLRHPLTRSLDLADPNTDPFEVAAAAAAVIAERTGAEPPVWGGGDEAA